MTTIRNIADAAGVSTSTASRALNDNPRISKETRERVKKIAEQLGYRPNFSAQNLSRGEANIVGVVFPTNTASPEPANPFHIEIMWGISQEIRYLHFEMMVAMGKSETDLVEQVKAMAQQAKVHNFILLYSKPHDPVIKYLREHDLTYVVVGHPFSKVDRFVDNDNVTVGRVATEQLYHHAKVQQPVFVQSINQRTFERDRYVGYCQAVRQVKGTPITLSVDESTNINAWLDQHTSVDGLIFADDVIYLRYAQELFKRKLPAICFNNSQWIKIVVHDQPVIDLQPQLLGKRAVKLLFNTNQKYSYVPFKVESSHA